MMARKRLVEFTGKGGVGRRQQSRSRMVVESSLVDDQSARQMCLRIQLCYWAPYLEYCLKLPGLDLTLALRQ